MKLVSALIVTFSLSTCFNVSAQEKANAPTPKRPLVNGDFEASSVGAPPVGWTPAYPTGTALVAKDAKDTFLRLTNAQPANAGMAQVVEVPPKVTTVAVLGRMRGKPQNEKVDKQAAVQVALRYLDSAGGSINAAIVTS